VGFLDDEGRHGLVLQVGHRVDVDPLTPLTLNCPVRWESTLTGALAMARSKVCRILPSG
jgi:hypothetical protein